jgi:hypothetical protein
MAEIITCPECQRRLRVPDEYRGKMVLCPRCKTQFSADVAFADDPRGASIAPSPIPTVSPPDPGQDARDNPDRPWEEPGFRRRPRAARVVRKPAGSGLGIALAILGTVFLVGLIAIGGIVALTMPRANPRWEQGVGVREDDRDRREQVQAAFGDPKPLAPGELEKELKRLFDQLGGAFLVGDGNAIAAHFDTERLMDEFTALVGAPPPGLRDKRAAALRVRQGIGDALARQAPLMRWTTSEIRNVKKLNDTEAVVIVRHTSADGRC